MRQFRAAASHTNHTTKLSDSASLIAALNRHELIHHEDQALVTLICKNTQPGWRDMVSHPSFDCAACGKTRSIEGEMPRMTVDLVIERQEICSVVRELVSEGMRINGLYVILAMCWVGSGNIRLSCCKNAGRQPHGRDAVLKLLAHVGREVTRVRAAEVHRKDAKRARIV